VACCRTKAAISLKRVKIQEKLLWTAYKNSPTLFRTVPSLTPYGFPFPKIGGLQLSYPLLSQERTTDFKFGRYIFRAYPNKSLLKILEKRERGRIQGLPIFGYLLLSQERVKLRTSNFVGTFIGSIGTKAHENVGYGRGRSQGVQKIFKAPICRAHCAVIFAIAQLSCNTCMLFCVCVVVDRAMECFCSFGSSLFL